jgi:creatinine amidohydrolase/Fe(II)-dependent formamide hydrolase-like protein
MSDPRGAVPASVPLDAVLAIDRLEVGPVEVGPDRLSCRYRVVRGGESDETTFSYRWEEPVFDLADPGALNLAAMAAVQPALNYGLFCRRIVLSGPFDRRDRRFLARKLENTSREIYVNKLLADNPFLTDAVRGLQPERRERYTRAELAFEPDAEPAAAAGAAAPAGIAGAPWNASPERWAVLSSGGKDSLLSYALLAELGCEVHPVFVNESGRHWYTALNAYRHFRERVPHTARVWTDSDRLFSWMLRHLPFVRPDFQRLRADLYPLRLWTVAVFVFGALPLLRARGIGRLVIGDEHDTTVRAFHDGIPHHAGLYDQSLFFDHALTRYYLSKGWGVTQLSLLRPLSELLIEKVLAERYPELLALQVSCHAASIEEVDGVKRALPCGKCEKCRRVAGMLLALGADPAACGYTPEQHPEILRRLVAEGVHQEAPAAEHLAWLLAGKGLLAEPRVGVARARRRPEALSLRFHPERSPLSEIPSPVRRRLIALLAEHAEGALERVGRQWLAVDPERAAERAAPYIFDRPFALTAARETEAGSSETVLWGELTWPDAERRLETVDIALLPVGAVEQHGPHLPLDVDAYDADRLAREVARACSAPRPLVLPLIPYGVSYHHEDFKGTLSVTNETLARLVYEIGMSAARQGVTKLVMINGHGGNAPTLHFAAQMINRDAHIFTTVDSGETSDAEVNALAETRNDVHAGEIETSTTLAARPELVRMDRAKAFVPRFSSRYLDFTGEDRIDWYAHTSKISESGVFGDPTKATREKGEAIWALMIGRLVELVEHLKGLSLAEIYERRQ